MASALAYCLGYFTPWASLSFLGLSIGINGGAGVELAAVAAAATAVGLGFVDYFNPGNTALAWLRTALCAGCLAFAGCECAQYLFFTYILQFGFGLLLMVLAGSAMLYFSFARSPAIVMPALPIAVISVALLTGFGGYRGWYARQNSLNQLQNLFGGGNTGTFPGSTAPGNSFGTGANNNPFDFGLKPRSDVDIRLNSTTELSILQPSSEFYAPRRPGPGKVFLVCNLTVTYNGKSGNMSPADGTMRLTANNKQLYDEYKFIEGSPSIKPLDARLLPGGSATGDVVFEVDAGAKAVSVELQSF